ncbi:hypothetical protein LTR66_000327 [Elasticomyces elasticus]|nr:hypothetical protein LTR66_000327 [Elasticomyces elasticus]
MNRDTEQMNERVARMKRSDAEKVKAYKEQVARLDESVQAMQVDLARPMAVSFGSRSFSSVSSSEVPLLQTISKISFNVSPPRDSLLHTPSRLSTKMSQRCALRYLSKDPIGDRLQSTMDLKLLNEDAAELDTPPKIRDRLEKGRQSTEGLHDRRLKGSKMWHTNYDVKIIHSVVFRK